jgi:hypothetical protein
LAHITQRGALAAANRVELRWRLPLLEWQRSTLNRIPQRVTKSWRIGSLRSRTIPVERTRRLFTLGG